jgi:ABC-type spermidine/putrescine transport system permease subunit II
VFNIADTTAGTTFILLCRTIIAMTYDTTVIYRRCKAMRRALYVASGNMSGGYSGGVQLQQINYRLYVTDQHTMRFYW